MVKYTFQMEHTEKIVKPASKRALLRQQLEEQHELCDMTVRHGTWVGSCIFFKQNTCVFRNAKS